MSPDKGRSSRRPTVVLSALTLLTMIVLWVLFVGGTRRNEMIAGAAVVCVSAAFMYQVWRIETLDLRFTLKDLVQGWRIPWYVISGVYEISSILLKDLFGMKQAGSFYRVSGFETSKSDPVLVARRILATFYTTMAPNFIVIGIDYHQSRMLFHQLERSSVPIMTKALGAKPGAQRS